MLRNEELFFLASVFFFFIRIDTIKEKQDMKKLNFVQQSLLKIISYENIYNFKQKIIMKNYFIIVTSCLCTFHKWHGIKLSCLHFMLLDVLKAWVLS